MLNFFRRYQKILFIFVTVMIVISFTFFGTFSTFVNKEEIPDHKIGKALDGSPIMSRDIECMNRFLRDGLEEGGKSANLLNGSIVHHEFLNSELAEILVESYWDDLKTDLESRFRKAKNYTPYVHPQVPFLSAKLVWERFSPEMNQLLEELKESKEELSPKTFSLLRKIYLAQTKLPAHMLKQVLMYQQSQYSWIRPDPMLMQDDLSLFGFHSVEDWFGPKFLTLISQFLINTAIYAQQKGYSISKEEAKLELILNAQRGLEAYSQGKQVSLEEARGYYYQTIQSLGMDEPKALAVWKRVMGFKRLFQESAGGVFLDPLSLNQFHSYTRESAKVDLYQLPEEFRFIDLRSLLRFQFYLDAVAADKNNEYDLPKSFVSTEMVEKKFPELVQKRFHLKIAKVKNSELTQRISLKDTWEWQLEEKNFAYLKEEFPLLALEPSSSRDERFLALEKCDEQLRFKIDQASRMHILKMHPEWIHDALNTATPYEETVALKSKGPVTAFEGVEDGAELIKLLENEDPKLLCYRPNDETYYRIQVLKKADGKEILTFAEAIQGGSLDRLIDQKLEAAYPEIRKKSPADFQVEKGNWKPFEEVKEKVASMLYRNLQNRLYHFVAHARKQLEINSEDISVLRPQVEEFARIPLDKQWMLVKAQKTFKRQKEMDALLTTAFGLKEGEWSMLLEQRDGDHCFFRLVERIQEQETSMEEVSEAQKVLVLEAQQCLMKEIVELFHEKKLVTLSFYENQ